jgi:hypothetical protein
MGTIFKKNWELLGNLELDLNDIENEKMFILSDLNYIKNNYTENGITQKFIQYFEKEILPNFEETNNKIWKINSKIHRLRKNWMPALGNWHLDNIDRRKNWMPELGNWHLDNIDRGSKTIYENGVEVKANLNQPDYLNKQEDIYILYVIGESARTQLLNCDIELEEPNEDENVYQSFHRQINEKYSDNIITMNSGDIIKFTSSDFHRGSESTIDKSFWRYFIRLQLTENVENIKNKERKQVQTYIDLGRDW